MAGPVAIAGDGAVEGTAVVGVDAAVGLAPQRHRVDPVDAVPGSGGGQLAGVEQVRRVEGPLDVAELGVEHRSEKQRRVLAAVAAAVLAPQQSPVALGQRRHLVRHRAYHPGVGGVGHVERRPDMEAADVRVSIHPVGQRVAVEDGAELRHEVGEQLGPHGRVLDERRPLPLPAQLPEQPDGLLADRPQLPDNGRVGHHGPVHGLEGRRGEQTDDFGAAAPHGVGVVTDELDEVQPPDGLGGGSPEHRLHARPDDVARRHRKDLVVDHLDGCGFGDHEVPHVAQRGIEGRVAGDDEGAVPGARQDPQGHRLRQCQRALRPGEQVRQVEGAVATGDPLQVVARQAAVDVGEGGVDQVSVLRHDAVHLAVDVTHDAAASAGRVEAGAVEGTNGPVGAV